MEPVRDHELYQGLESALGATVATGLMERLPPPPVDRLATKDDVAVVSGELAALRSDVDQRFDKIDQRFDKIDLRFDKMDERFAQMDLRFTAGEVGLATLGGKVDTLRQEMVGLHHETLAAVRGEMISAIHTQGRQLTVALVSSLVGLSGLAFLLSQLAP